ncbi:MAG: head-tail adaptor protein [Rhodobacteraceae bacterium]|nr:head-tail adaptor protein [Paracoccaceae bacterium]
MVRHVELNRKLTLERRQRVSDGAGGFERNWVALGEVWADVQMRSVRVTEVSAGTTALERHRIIVRGAPQGDPQRPMPGQRFVEGSRIYGIESVTEHDHAGLYLLCWTREEVLT